MSLNVSASVSTAAVAASMPSIERGQYDEIVSLVADDGSALRPSTVVAMFASVLPEKFVEFDKKKRGDALNIDLYGYDEEQEVAVVQIRHFFRRYKNGFGNTHKSYVLVGRNDESREYFRHPVSSAAVRAGIRKDPSNPVAAVRAAQRWMWNVTDKQLAAGIRQGDVLLVPVRGKPAGATAIEERVVVVGGTHEVSARAFAKDAKGVVYAEAPTIRHTKNQHSAVYGDGDGWHAVKVAQEADTWDWGVRLGD